MTTLPFIAGLAPEEVHRLHEAVRINVATALEEDIGAGDLTASLLPANMRASARVISREKTVLCGLAWFEACFRALDPAVKVYWLAHARLWRIPPFLDNRPHKTRRQRKWVYMVETGVFSPPT